METSTTEIPTPFGYKCQWLAIKTGDEAAVANTLGLTNPQRVPWNKGLSVACDFEGIFVTPPVQGWVFAIGNVPGPDSKSFTSTLEALSKRFGKAYYFGTQHVVEFHAWAIAEGGHVTRAFAYVGERGEFPVNLGSPTPEEVQLHTGVAERDKSPDEETVLSLASAWTFDPRMINGANVPRRNGLLSRN